MKGEFKSMSNISEFIDIPKFISVYIENTDTDLNYITHEFCKSVMSTDDISATTINDKIIYKIKLYSNIDKIEKLVNFYIEKSKLNYKFDCLYEDELGIPKSIDAELFKIRILNSIHNVVIQSFDLDKKELVFEEVE